MVTPTPDVSSFTTCCCLGNLLLFAIIAGVAIFGILFVIIFYGFAAAMAYRLFQALGIYIKKNK